MEYNLDDTIVAIASPPGGAARGVVRVSGPGTLACLRQVFQASDENDASFGRNFGRKKEEAAQGDGEREIESKASRLRERELNDSQNDSALRENQRLAAKAMEGRLNIAGFHAPVPCTLYLWPGQRSFTRQPSAELHTVGSPPLLHAIVNALCQAGGRSARAGEFTLRAFLSGRIDLTQAEAVLGVIEASDEAQLRAALDQAAGGVGGALVQLRERLLDLLAELEAGMDFVEEDIEFIAPRRIEQVLHAAQAEVQQAIATLAWRKRADERATVVLAGAPNAGKSSLLNALAGKDAAMVSDRAGTTRDFLELEIEIGGAVVRLIDTAGVSGEDPATSASSASGDSALGDSEIKNSATIDSMAQRQSESALAQADVVLHCLAADQLEAAGPHATPTSEAQSQVIDQNVVCLLRVLTKADLVNAEHGKGDAMMEQLLATSECHVTSSRTGDGIASLRSELASVCGNLATAKATMLSFSVHRCEDALRRAEQSLNHALDNLRPMLQEELVAADARAAVEQIGNVVGAVYTDDLLDRIFSRFCIGK